MKENEKVATYLGHSHMEKAYFNFLIMDLDRLVIYIFQGWTMKEES
jgi:hypothetical protein